MNIWAPLFTIIGLIGIGLWIRDIMKNRHTATQSSDASSNKIDWHVTHYPVDEILQKGHGPKRRRSKEPVSIPGGIRFTYEGDKVKLLELAAAEDFETLAPYIRLIEEEEEPGNGLELLLGGSQQAIGRFLPKT